MTATQLNLSLSVIFKLKQQSAGEKS